MSAKAKARGKSRRRRVPVTLDEIEEIGAAVIEPEPEKPIDLEAIFGAPHLFPRADAIAKLCGLGEGWYYTTLVQRQSWCIEGALRNLKDRMGTCRIVFPPEPAGAMCCVVETTDHRIGCAISQQQGVVLGPGTQAFTVSTRRVLARHFGEFGDPW